MGSEDILLEAGKSAELSACLLSLTEAEVDGEPKYSSKMCREVGKLIVCRTYASAVLELCHLIRAASFASPMAGRYEYLFWDSGIAQPSNFQRYFQTHGQTCDPALIQLDHRGITLSYEDGIFSVHYARMPVLSAFMEFLLTALGFSDLDDAFRPLHAERLRQKEISEIANHVSRLIYDYLKHHLPTAQSQKKFRKILEQCEDDVERIDDDFVLNFWQNFSHPSDKNADFKTFESVVLSIVRVIQAVEAARDLQALQHAGSLGMNREAGEINPEHLSQALDQVEDTAAPLKSLADEPINQIKFLNKQECSHLETLVNAGALAFRLPLSVMRSNIFAKPQNKLTQALRRQAPPNELSEIITQGPDETYLERQKIYANLCDHMKKVVYASLYALIKARSPKAIDLLLMLHPNLDYQGLQEHLVIPDQPDNVVSLDVGLIAQHFLDQLHDPARLGPELADVLDHARSCFQKISRKGFQESPENGEDKIEGFAKGGEMILSIRNDVEAFRERLENVTLTGGGWEAQYSLDRTIFSGQFNLIYGGP